ncbi:hypothetical protein AJ80_00664 [Polytolypa hystricis UAMH7299]|uniref:PH-response regulator protein palH/RIM21 n=1 Tax=Polytolypa hystricis (strain UAMH7299) TaxID=1447883 RepID=A0A2B7Z2R5_POLH7|nr:hypothetical protein AJ80_00664 [Polytolypa hystricis UAMH7299]
MSFIGLLFRDLSKTNNSHPICPATVLPEGGKLFINDTLSIFLTHEAVYRPPCATDPDKLKQLLIHHESFYASTSPQMYAIAAATIISYLLVFILFITPRTFIMCGPGGSTNFLGRRGMLSSSYGSSSVIGVGGRPWLQKVAALTVAISLSIATADTFQAAKVQYDRGYTNASALTYDVIGGVEIRIVRVISSTFLWLAQVQTLIRLFPRHKEKVIIKWTGFALIVLDTVFSILNNFVYRTPNILRPRTVSDVVPALSYLFELSLSLLYAAWVVFYALSKHRFAFFHVKMRNICLVALLSLIAILIPVIFFILDISKPDVAGWGEYIRWVGAAAASVVVWEWVERIEALERDERKDGILGREIFDGDEMLEVTPSEEVSPKRGGQNGGGGTSSGWAGVMGLSHRPLRSRVTFQNRLPRVQRRQRRNQADNTEEAHGDSQPTVPPLAITPISRADTTSVASTIYRVRYHSVGSPSESSVEFVQNDDNDNQNEKEVSSTHPPANGNQDDYNTAANAVLPPKKGGIRWSAVPNPFKRRRASPPTEVASAQARASHHHHPHFNSRPAVDEERCPRMFRSKVDALMHFGHPREGGSRDRSLAPKSMTLPVTVIPARSRPGPRVDAPEDSSSRSENILESSSRQGGHSAGSHDNASSLLPVTVVPTRTQSSRAWSVPPGDSNSPARERRGDEPAIGVDSSTTPLDDSGIRNGGQRREEEAGFVVREAAGDESARGMNVQPGPEPEPDPSDPPSTGVSPSIARDLPDRVSHSPSTDEYDAVESDHNHLPTTIANSRSSPLPSSRPQSQIPPLGNSRAAEASGDIDLEAQNWPREPP